MAFDLPLVSHILVAQRTLVFACFYVLYFSVFVCEVLIASELYAVNQRPKKAL